jgi:ATP-dependent Clp protease ATP-binding subunit ClpB
MEIDSMPEEMDQARPAPDPAQDRARGAQEGSDEAAKKQPGTAREQIDDLEREFADLDEIWKAEKAACRAPASIKGELEQPASRSRDRAARR